jgi:hypothetical protein
MASLCEFRDPQVSLSKREERPNILDMERFGTSRVRLWRLSRWQAGLLVTLVIAIGIAVAVVAGVAVLILTPIFLLAAVALKYLVRPSKQARGPFSAGGKVIDADYEIIPPDRPADPKVVDFDRNRRSG